TNSPTEATAGRSSPRLPQATQSRWSRRTMATHSRTPLSGPCFSGLGVGRLVVVGAQADWCVRSTLHGAVARGYDATLVGDAHTTEDQADWEAPPPDKVIAHRNLYRAHQTAPGEHRNGGLEGRRFRRPDLRQSRARSPAWRVLPPVPSAGITKPHSPPQCLMML